jgi:hypothetical protein
MKYIIKIFLAPLVLISHAYALEAMFPIEIKVWKSPTCDCCSKWVDHLKDNGFSVTIFDEGNTKARSKFGISKKYGSCHTASVNGYAIEGHVPAQDIKKLLENKPIALGLAVPGMPVGSPGMDGELYRNRKDSFDVFLLKSDQSHEVFSSY